VSLVGARRLSSSCLAFPRPAPARFEIGYPRQAGIRVVLGTARNDAVCTRFFFFYLQGLPWRDTISSR